MKIKIFIIALVCVFFIDCASIETPKGEPDFYKFYHGISSNEIWNATLKAIDDSGLVPREKSKEKGFIYARRRPGHSLQIPSITIFIRDDNGKIRVGCVPIIASSSISEDALQKEKKKWAEWFFDSLEKRLKI